MTPTQIIIVLLAISWALNLYQLTGHVKLRNVLRAGLRKAELDRASMVRLSYNQLAELMGWKPEFTSYTNTKTGEREVRQASVFPIKETKP